MFGALTGGEDNNHPDRAAAFEIREKTETGIRIQKIFSYKTNANSPV
jgi:hypothetical protein